MITRVKYYKLIGHFLKWSFKPIFFFVQFYPLPRGEILVFRQTLFIYYTDYNFKTLYISMSCELLIYCVMFLLFRPRLSLKPWGNVWELRLISWQRRPDHYMVNKLPIIFLVTCACKFKIHFRYIWSSSVQEHWLGTSSCSCARLSVISYD